MFNWKKTRGGLVALMMGNIDLDSGCSQLNMPCNVQITFT